LWDTKNKAQQKTPWIQQKGSTHSASVYPPSEEETYNISIPYVSSIAFQGISLI
jgi:hypothetical protein